MYGRANDHSSPQMRYTRQYHNDNDYGRYEREHDNYDYIRNKNTSDMPNSRRKIMYENYSRY